MAQSKRVLFVAGDVLPFTQGSSIAPLARGLPEQLQDAGDFEARIMMPCYETIDEREHSLHEVIRLSDTEVPMGDETETLTVKVASVPEVRLQVYFMDHDSYFQTNEPSSDSSSEGLLRRTLFFNRAAFETIRKLRWGPDLIHSFGWMGGLGPLLLSSDYQEEDLLNESKTIYTPGDRAPGTPLESGFPDSLGVSFSENGASSFSDAGLEHADASIYPPGLSPSDGDSQFRTDDTHHGDQLVELYDQMLNEVPA